MNVFLIYYLLSDKSEQTILAQPYQAGVYLYWQTGFNLPIMSVPSVYIFFLVHNK